MEGKFPPESQGDPDFIIEYLYNQLQVEEGGYQLDKIVDHYFKNGFLILNAGCVGDTLGGDNIIEVTSNIMKKYVPKELAGYMKNYVVGASIWKVI